MQTLCLSPVMFQSQSNLAVLWRGHGRKYFRNSNNHCCLQGIHWHALTMSFRPWPSEVPCSLPLLCSIHTNTYVVRYDTLGSGRWRENCSSVRCIDWNSTLHELVYFCACPVAWTFVNSGLEVNIQIVQDGGPIGKPQNNMFINTTLLGSFLQTNLGQTPLMWMSWECIVGSVRIGK